MLNLLCLISHYDTKATTKNLIGFNDTKSLRSVAARRASLFVVSSLALLTVGEYARHNKLNLPLVSIRENSQIRKISA